MRDPEIFPPIKPDHAAAIGYVAAHWSLVEEHLAFIIYSLLGLQAIPGHAVTAELSTLQRISTISAFVSLTGNQAWIDTWDDITKTLDNLRNRRNDAVHSTWRVVGPEHWHMRVKAKGRVSIKQGAISTTSLMSHPSARRCGRYARRWRDRSDRFAALGGGQVSAPRRTRQAC